MNKNTLKYRIIHFPLVKILTGFIVVLLVVGVGQTVSEQVLNLIDIERDFRRLIIGIITSALAILSYALLYKYYEKRKITEFSKQSVFKSLAFGFILGFVLQSLTILVIYLKGGYSFVSINPIWYILPPLTMSITSAIIEEILIRGILFRILEEKLGSYIALVISAIIFGALHLGNDNSSLIVGVGLAIEAGLMLGVAYIYTRNLWLPIAIHFAWNFTQSAIYGANVSGIKMSKTLISSEITGDVIFTGGGFGPEGSIQALLICLVATIIMLVLAHKKGNIIKPFWSK